MSRIVSRAVSTAARSQKIYELRQYQVSPIKLKEYRDLTVDRLHLRTKHSRLVGYWMTELGALNKAFHIWEYDSISQRAEVRAALAEDPDWHSLYVYPAISSLVDQKNCVCHVRHGSCDEDWPDSGLYQLFEMTVLSTFAGDGHAILDDLVETLQREGYGEMMASFSPVIGHQSKYFLVSRHKGNDIVDLPDLSSLVSKAKIVNRMLLPLPWSKWTS